MEYMVSEGSVMGSTVNKSELELDKRSGRSPKWFANWKFIATSIVIIIALVLAAISYYQATHFNAHIKINDINVGGMTAEQALKELKTSVLKNEVYVGQQKLVDGNDTSMGITNEDLPAVKKLLKSQKTLFPSLKEKAYSLIPSNPDPNRSQELKTQVEEQLLSMNKNLKVPKDADVYLEQGKIIVSPSEDGEQYDVASLLKEFDEQKFTGNVQLNPVFIQPIKEDSPLVKEKEKKLQELLQQSVDYKVQDKVHTLKGSELIKNATVSKEMKVTIDPGDINKKIAEINSSQSTLDKDFTFKTHSGSVISVKGQGYGWALDVDKETALVKAAFEIKEKSIAASNIIGHGWSNEGYGYETTTNYGIGDTYAEVSIAEQRIWIYKEGKLVLTTNVVTGKHVTGEDTSPGVWYILFKRTPYTLKGSAVGKANYEVEVDYWAPFTNSGQGFHDASWRTNWASNAYLAAGSGGCVNVPANVMKSVYENLSTHEPVVVY
jgi:hypothetical protein